MMARPLLVPGPDSSEPRRLLDALYPYGVPEGTQLLAVAFDGSAFERERLDLATLAEGWPALAAKAATRDWFYSVNAVRDDLGKYERGGKKDVRHVAAFVMDVDCGDDAKGFEAIDDAKAALDKLPLKPSALVRSGKGLHAYWFIEGGWDCPDAEEALNAWAQGTAWGHFVRDSVGVKLDAAWDISRVLRLPGTFHHKTGQPLPVTLQELHPERRYNPSDFEEFAGDGQEFLEEVKEIKPRERVAASGNTVKARGLVDLVREQYPKASDPDRNVRAACVWGVLERNAPTLSRADKLEAVQVACDDHPKGRYSPKELAHSLKKFMEPERPKLILHATDDHLANVALGAHLAASGRCFNLDGYPVELDETTTPPTFRPMAPENVQLNASKAGAIWKIDSRKAAKGAGEAPAGGFREITKAHVRAGLPKEHAQRFCKDPVGLERVKGIAHGPFLRPDGSVCTTRGLDKATGVFLTEDFSSLGVPHKPTKAEATAALAEFDKVIGGFPFATSGDKGTAVSGFLTLIARPAMDTPPAHLITAHVASSGKGQLVGAVTTVAHGHRAPLAPWPDDEKETKRIVLGKLMGASPVILFDECSGTIQSPSIQCALTSGSFEGVRLYQNVPVNVPFASTLFLLGNNCTPGGDMVRRTIRCLLDPKCERPEEREFKESALTLAKRHRMALLRAAFVVLRWALTSKLPKPPGVTGSFEDWDRLVRTPLAALGFDPQANRHELRGDDAERDMLEQVIGAAYHYGVGAKFTAGDLWAWDSNLEEALTTGKRPMAKFVGRPLAGLRIVRLQGCKGRGLVTGVVSGPRQLFTLEKLD